MIQLRNTRQIIIAVIIIAVVFFIYSDDIVAYVSTLSPLWIMVLTTLLNPAYLLLIWFLANSYGFKGAIAGFFIAISSDIISLPHILTKLGIHSTLSFNLFQETNFYDMLPSFLKFNITLPIVGQINFGVFLVYVGISVGLVILALMIVHKRRFKEIFLKSI